MTNSPGNLGYRLVRRTLDNGLRVVINPDPSAPVVAVNLWYDVGSRDEMPGRTGLAHLFEHVMFQGSAHVGSGEHLAALQAVGGSVNATTWFDRTNYFEAVPTGALDLALWLEADRLGTLLEALTQVNLDNQRDVVKEEKRQRYDNVPYGDAMEHLVGLAFPAGHPYGHTTIGSMADLDAATLADARDFFACHYLPSNAVLTLVGDVDPDDAFRRVATHFGDLPARPRPQHMRVSPLPPLSGGPRATRRADVPTDAVYATWRLPARDQREFDCLDVAMAILGDGQASRLYRSLVREARIAESSGASALALIGGNSLGLAYARALPGIAPDELEAALLAEFDRFAEVGPTAEELDRTKAQHEREWLSQLARFDTRADTFGCYATLLGDPELVNSRIAAFSTISATEVVEAARRWLGGDQSAILHYLKPAAPTANADEEAGS